jgi:hypothetical protein
MTTDSETVCV